MTEFHARITITPAACRLNYMDFQSAVDAELEDVRAEILSYRRGFRAAEEAKDDPAPAL